MSIESIVNKMCEVFHVSSNCINTENDNITLNTKDYTVHVSFDYVSISATNATLKTNPQLMTQVDAIQSFLN